MVYIQIVNYNIDSCRPSRNDGLQHAKIIISVLIANIFKQIKTSHHKKMLTQGMESKMIFAMQVREHSELCD